MRGDHRAARLLPWLLILYACTSLGHFTHNAEYLSAYPNLPPHCPRGEVYLVFGLVCLPGLLGWLLYRGGAVRAGLTLLYVYAGLGLGALLHRLRAPFHRHTALMNVTILAEATAALVLLVNLTFLTRESSR